MDAARGSRDRQCRRRPAAERRILDTTTAYAKVATMKAPINRRPSRRIDPEGNASGYDFERAFDMTGKVVLVTAAAGGIGRGVARMFAARGARLVLVEAGDEVDQLASALVGDTHVALRADVSQTSEAERVVAAVMELCERLDVLVNNADALRLADAEHTTDDDWDHTMAVNLRGPFVMARAAVGALSQAGSGRIINIASQAAVVALTGHLAYGASKAGVLALTRTLASEWAKYGITVNAISPTVIEGEHARTALAGELGVQMKRRIPTGRFAHPDEIGLAALYLASGAASMITGENLVVDGGYTIQ